MAEFNIGDRVKIKDRKDWPYPPGMVLAEAEGTVVKWIEYDEVMIEFPEYLLVHIETAGASGKPYIGNKMCFRSSDLMKI